MNRTQAGEHADMVALTGINGRTFDMERIDVETKLGTSEVWEVVSAGMAHPFHIHGACRTIRSGKNRTASRRKAAAFARWHEPDDARVSSPICERLGVKFPGPTRPNTKCDQRKDEVRSLGRSGRTSRAAEPT